MDGDLLYIRELKCTWSNVVKLGQSLYREAPGMDVFRPKQRTPVDNFYLAGSYTYQVNPCDGDGEVYKPGAV